jgi:orotate phosphoribosyltransferase
LADIDQATYGKLCYSFDRKEKKYHGEGGGIVGAPLKGKRVLIVDDVVTAGTAKREAIGKIRDEGGIVAGIGRFCSFFTRFGGLLWRVQYLGIWRVLGLFYGQD